MIANNEPSAAERREELSDPVSEADLERVLQEVPRGAAALAGTTVALLVIGWLAMYFGVFLPRGPIG